MNTDSGQDDAKAQRFRAGFNAKMRRGEGAKILNYFEPQMNADAHRFRTGFNAKTRRGKGAKIPGILNHR